MATLEAGLSAPGAVPQPSGPDVDGAGGTTVGGSGGPGWSDGCDQSATGPPAQRRLGW